MHDMGYSLGKSASYLFVKKKRGEKEKKKNLTLQRRVAPLILVSSMPSGSFGLMFSRSFASRGNRTLEKKDHLLLGAQASQRFPYKHTQVKLKLSSSHFIPLVSNGRVVNCPFLLLLMLNL